jgi:hypothetical protein
VRLSLSKQGDSNTDKHLTVLNSAAQALSATTIRSSETAAEFGGDLVKLDLAAPGQIEPAP